MRLKINDWLVVFNVPSTARSCRDGTPIYCPLRSDILIEYEVNIGIIIEKYAKT